MGMKILIEICFSHSRKIVELEDEVKLVKDQCRLDIRKYSVSQRTINEGNKLSTDCVTASSVNMFKNNVDTYFRRVGYNFGLSISKWLPCRLLPTLLNSY